MMKFFKKPTLREEVVRRLAEAEMQHLNAVDYCERAQATVEMLEVRIERLLSQLESMK